MTNHAVSNRADLRERTKIMSRHGNRQRQIADFWGSFETINWLYLHIKSGIKPKTHFEWLLWHWSSLGQLNLEPAQAKGLVGCKVPTDVAKINVKKATHMGFYRYGLAKCCRTFFCWNSNSNFCILPTLTLYDVSLIDPCTLAWMYCSSSSKTNRKTLPLSTAFSLRLDSFVESCVYSFQYINENAIFFC